MVRISEFRISHLIVEADCPVCKEPSGTDKGGFTSAEELSEGELGFWCEEHGEWTEKGRVVLKVDDADPTSPSVPISMEAV